MQHTLIFDDKNVLFYLDWGLSETTYRN